MLWCDIHFPVVPLSSSSAVLKGDCNYKRKVPIQFLIQSQEAQSLVNLEAIIEIF